VRVVSERVVVPTGRGGSKRESPFRFGRSLGIYKSRMSELIGSAKYHSLVVEDRRTLFLELRGLPAADLVFTVDILSRLRLHHSVMLRLNTIIAKDTSMDRKDRCVNESSIAITEHPRQYVG